MTKTELQCVYDIVFESLERNNIVVEDGNEDNEIFINTNGIKSTITISDRRI